MKYRKKPVVVEAVLWDGSLKAADEIATLMNIPFEELQGLHTVSMAIPIPTLEGLMKASIGDFIIKGIKGEVYPCKPDIFAATYDFVDEEQKTPLDFNTQSASNEVFEKIPQAAALTIMRNKDKDGKIRHLAIGVLSDDDMIVMTCPLGIEEAQHFADGLQEIIDAIKEG